MIKSGLVRNIICGLIFSIIFAFMGDFLYKRLSKGNTIWYTKLYLLEIVINNNINKFRNVGIATESNSNFITDHFFSSLEYTLFVFKKRNTYYINDVCNFIKVTSSDRSILFETGLFLEKDDELLDSCMSKIISDSFKRFKEKVIILVEDETALKKLAIKKLRLEVLEREKQILNRSELQSELLNIIKKEKKISSYESYALKRSLCDNIDILVNNAITDVGIYLENDVENTAFIGKSLSLDNLISLSKKCNKGIQTVSLDNDIEKLKDAPFSMSASQANEVNNNIVKSKEVSNQINKNEINKLNNQINEIQEFISFAKLEDFFHLQKYTNIDSEHRKLQYLTKTQTLITFLILGFIVGFILSSNFPEVLKKNK